MMMKKVKFSKKNPREYHKELLNNPPENIEYIFNKSNKKHEHQLTNNITVKSKIAHLLLKSKISNKIGLFLPNVFFKKDHNQYDYIHSFNRLCISNSPYVLELENGTAFLHYQPQKINILTKYVVKKFVTSKNMKSIVFNSNASMKSFEQLFPTIFNLEEVQNKSKVIYPLVPENKIVSENFIRGKLSKNKVTFLFISSTFDLKGGKELVNAFLKLENTNKNVELKIISKKKDISNDVFEKINSNDSIIFLESEFSRKELYEHHYPYADVFILPTFRDSFGLVILEAMKSGLPIISTDTFAIPELVNEKNGILIRNNFSFFNDDFSVNEKNWGDKLLKFVKNNYDDDLEKDIFSSMNLMLDEEKRIEMSLKSLHISNALDFGETSIQKEWFKIFN